MKMLDSMDVQIKRIYSSLDKLVESATPYGGLFLSVIDLETGTIPFNLPPSIPGQRDCDRSFPGSNLMHDHVVLKLMYDLSEMTGESRFAAGADRYLQRFASHCTHTATGLFPWGEHSFWNLMEDRPGSSYPLARVATMATHDHLQQAPAWLWEKLWSLNAHAVERFCQGLSRHFLDVDPPQYNRHANLLESHYLKRNRAERSCDFPRHSGFYIYDWCFAYARTGSPLYRRYIDQAMDYWWLRRRPGQMLPSESRTVETYHASANSSQTLSLALSLLEAASLVEVRDPHLANVLRERGDAYSQTVLDAPHDPDRGRFVMTVDPVSREASSYAAIWGSSYGTGIMAASLSMLLLAAYRLTSNPHLLDIAERIGRYCAASEIPTNQTIPVKDAGVHLALLADLYSLTGEQEWLEQSQRWADILTSLFFDRDLPRSAVGLSIYESQLLPGHLLRGLARTALMADGKDIGPDYTLR